MSASWLNPAGGLRYHVRALLGGRPWAPFRVALGGWLAGFEPRVPRGVLVGPSAGYTFPDAFLRRFTALTVLEPDPIAGYLLLRRLRLLGVSALRLESRDLLIAPLLDGSAGLAELLRADPEACLIFWQCAGSDSLPARRGRVRTLQVCFSRAHRPAARRPLLAQLSRPPIGHARAKLQRTLPHSRAPRRPRGAARAVRPQDRGGAPEELFDHQSDGFFPANEPHAYFSWQIDARRHHLIEGVLHNF